MADVGGADNASGSGELLRSQTMPMKHARAFPRAALE